MKTKIAYIHGRPSPHPMHRKFAEAVGSKFHFVDFKMRWQDKNKTALYRMISSLVCAFSFPNKKFYNIFLVDNLHFMPVIMKKFRMISRNQKIVAHLGSHTLYFIYAHRFSRFTEWLHVQALKRYDALICEGKMAEDLVRKILKKEAPKTYTIINGIPNEHINNEVTIKLTDSKNILFIGHGPGKERLWYKGLDLMIEAFAIASSNDAKLKLTIVGEWDKNLIEKLFPTLDENVKKRIVFTGSTQNLQKYTLESALYLHCARGEAYGITILIAMNAGVPPIISEWTGAKEIVELVDKRLIVPLEPEKIAERIAWYFKLSAEEKKNISEKCQGAVKSYTEENAIYTFENKFHELEKDFGF